jgi:hypothetical protein
LLNLIYTNLQLSYPNISSEWPNIKVGLKSTTHELAVSCKHIAAPTNVDARGLTANEVHGNQTNIEHYSLTFNFDIDIPITVPYPSPWTRRVRVTTVIRYVVAVTLFLFICFM